MTIECTNNEKNIIQLTLKDCPTDLTIITLDLHDKYSLSDLQLLFLLPSIE